MDKRDSNLLLVLLSSAVLLISTFIFTSAVQKEPKIRFGKASENVVTKELVSGFPLIPEYPASYLENSYKQEDGTSVRYVGNWLTSDSVPQVEMWYKEELVDSGWVIDNLPADENDEQIQYLVAKKTELTLQLSIIRGKAQNITQIVVEFPPPINEDES